jgi:hypothetical protein
VRVVPRRQMREFGARCAPICRTCLTNPQILVQSQRRKGQSILPL